MTTFRATFTVEHLEGRTVDDEYVRTALEEHLEGAGDSFFATDDDDHEGEYSYAVDVVDVAP